MMLAKIRDAGFTIRLDGESLIVSPYNKLTIEQRTFIKNHKAEIVALLIAENDCLTDDLKRSVSLTMEIFKQR